MNKQTKWLILLILSFFCWPTAPLFANEFDNSYILDDTDIFDNTAMNLDDIQKFLSQRNGTLHNYSTFDINNESKTAAEIIYDAAQRHQINPKFLLVTLQKEQSLIEHKSPTKKQYDWATGYGVCDDCDPDDPALFMFKGFGTQVDRAAGLQRWYVENSQNGWLKVKGGTYIIDGHTITIKNQATANLYNYTPHVAGNFNLWKIWNRWFNQKYPDGSLLQVKDEAGVWIIKQGLRRPFLTRSALISRYNVKNIIIVNKKEMEQYPLGNPIRYSNYSLLINPKQEVYLLVDDILRPFENKEVLRTLGYNPEEFEPITDQEFSSFAIGETIGMNSAYPVGALLQNKQNGAVFYVENGIKKPIITKDILKINYPKFKLTPVSPEELDKFTLGETVRLNDGELVKAKDNATVYVIGNGEKHPIANASVFKTLGYNWKNVQVVEPKSLENLPLGEVIDLDYKQ